MDAGTVHLTTDGKTFVSVILEDLTQHSSSFRKLVVKTPQGTAIAGLHFTCVSSGSLKLFSKYLKYPQDDQTDPVHLADQNTTIEECVEAWLLGAALGAGDFQRHVVDMIAHFEDRFSQDTAKAIQPYWGRLLAALRFKADSDIPYKTDISTILVQIICYSMTRLNDKESEAILDTLDRDELKLVTMHLAKHMEHENRSLLAYESHCKYC